MVCALSGLPGTIQLSWQHVVTAWFMLRSFICLSCLYNPSAPITSVFLSTSLPGLPALTLYLNAKKAESTSRLRLFLSYCDEPRATFCAVGREKTKNCCQGVVGRDSGEKCDGNGEALHLYNIICERCWQATVWVGQRIRSLAGSVSQQSVRANAGLCWLTEDRQSASDKALFSTSHRSSSTASPCTNMWNIRPTGGIESDYLWVRIGSRCKWMCTVIRAWAVDS